MSARGSVAFPPSDAEAVLVLATNLARMAQFCEANVGLHQRSQTTAAGRWNGAASRAFSDAQRRRAEHARRAALSLHAAGSSLTQHGQVVQRTTQGYEVAAQQEQYLRRNAPNAKDAIDAAIAAQAQQVSWLLQSAEATEMVIREAVNEFKQMSDRARKDSGRPGVRDQANTENFFSDESSDAAALRPTILSRIDRGTLTPDPNSRLGAYAATAGYPPGSVGNAVHRAIGSIYLSLGAFGEEQIGTVFNSPEAVALFDKPLTRETSRQIAEIEHGYWRSVRDRNPSSAGGQLGSAFDPTVRDWLQREVFGTTPPAVPPAK